MVATDMNENQIKGIAAEAIGVNPDEENDILDFIMNLAMVWYSVESTAYDFYNGL